MLNEKVFKSYDIRGIYPTEINEEAAYEIGRAFANFTNAKKVVVGRDMRLGSPALHKGLLRGLTEQEVNVDDIGLTPIDAVYFAVGKFGYGGGIMITASHNPKEYAGMKMTGKNFHWIRGTELHEFMAGRIFEKKNIAGGVFEKDIMPDYIKHVFSFIDKSKFKPLKIVIDAGNGMAGKVIPLLFEHLPFHVVPLFFELDGNFPNHPSNPLLPESQIEITKKVIEEKADLGVIMDGDTDRLFFIDEKGNFTRADTTLILLAQHLLKQYPGAGVAYNLICSRAVPEFIRKFGGRPIRSKVGFVNVAQAMRENGGVLGGEVSAHYSFKDNYYADSGFIALVIVLQLLSESGKKFSELVKDFNPYFRADELNLEIADSPVILKQLKERYEDGKQDELDGLTVQYDDWWFNVRPSNTEPLLRVTVEGNTKAIMEEKSGELVQLIQSLGDRN